MPKPSNDLTKTCKLLEETIAWANLLDRLPLVTVCEDLQSFENRGRPLLEFGFHAGGTEMLIELGPHRAVSAPGTVLVINGHFGYRGTSRETSRICWVSFNVSRSAPVKEVSKTPILLTARATGAERILNAHRAALANYRRQGIFAEVRLKCEVIGFLAALYESICKPGDAPLPRSAAVEAALDLVNSAYEDPGLRRCDLARAAHLSEAHFARLFRQELGTCPMKHLRQFRIARACELLDRTRLNVEEVGRAVGLPNPFHFSRAFRATTGVSPRAYRNRRD